MRVGDDAPSGGLWGELRTRLLQGPLARSRARQPRTHVITDTAAALPAGYVDSRAAWLSVVAMPVTVDGQVYVEGEDDVVGELSLGLAMGAKVSTSRPAPGQLLRCIERAVQAGAERVVVVCISSVLSGTVDSARWAADHAAVPVHVVDSLSVAMAEGFAVMAAVEAARAGAPLEEIVEAAGSAGRSKVWFCVPSLEQLRRGGRIGAVASVIGTLLNVKPLLTVDRAGAVVATERTRTMPRAIALMTELGIDEASRPGRVRVAVHHFGAAEEAERLAAVMAPHSDEPILVSPVPAVLAAHTGAGVLALVVRREA